MKKTLFFLLLICSVGSPALRAQVAIGTSPSATPHPSAMLDVQSTTRGMLVPRMTSAQRTAIAAPAKGLLVFDNTSGTFWYHDADGWVELVAGNPQNNLHDADKDTKIQVEKKLDDDIVRVDLAGTERLVLRQNPGGLTMLELPNNSDNVFIGPNAGRVNTTGGYQNTAIGAQALYTNTTGYQNTAIGSNALYTNTTGLQNIAIGSNALSANTTGQKNIAIGSLANSHNLTGFSNTAVGVGTMGIAIGGIVPGSGNSAFGSGAGFSTETVFNNCTFLGSGTQISFGTTRFNSTAVGNGASITASNQVRLGNSAVASIGGQVSWTTFSDGRFKTGLSENVPGLDFIGRLRPLTYRLEAPAIAGFLGENTANPHENDPQEPLRDAESALLEKSAIRYSGFVAQEVEQAAAACGYEFSGLDAPKNPGDFYGLRYAEFTVPLVRAVQELQVLLQARERENGDLQKRLSDLETRLQSLETEH